MKRGSVRGSQPVIEVECYSGYRGAEEPRALVIDGRRLTVQQIISRSQGPAGRHFRVRASDGREYDLLHEEATGHWTAIGRT